MVAPGTRSNTFVQAGVFGNNSCSPTAWICLPSWVRWDISWMTCRRVID